MEWNLLTTKEQLSEWHENSDEHPVLLFKHSNSCMISRTVLDRVERSWNEQYAKQFIPVLLDLKKYRDISNQIAEQYDVQHESPQILYIKNKKNVFDASHMTIDLSQIPV